MYGEPSSRNRKGPLAAFIIVLLAVSVAIAAVAPRHVSGDSPMMRGRNGWSATTLLTVGDDIAGYRPPGMLDGLATFARNDGSTTLLVNHELRANQGYAYELANGTKLRGARVSELSIDTDGQLVAGAVAFGTIHDRAGVEVTSAAQINERDHPTAGFTKLCSASGYQAGQRSFEDDLFFTGEEARQPDHPHGGTAWVIDTANHKMWAAPAIGRGAWENIVAIDTGNDSTIGLLLGDDAPRAPLYLYLGQKNARGDGSFLDRNGLAVGQLFVWASVGAASPTDQGAEGTVLSGGFLPLDVRTTARSGQDGYDALGYHDAATIRAEAVAMGAFEFSRPEDIAVDPGNGRRAVMASTGDGAEFPSDNWGTVYGIVIAEEVADGGGPIPAAALVLHDTDAHGDSGIRSPDNVAWAADGFVYVQEDRATTPRRIFGNETGREASIARLNPLDATFSFVAEMDRSVVLPIGTVDTNSGQIGAWESSGVLDVSAVFPAESGTVLLATVQPHGVTGEVLERHDLVTSGQILLLRQN